MMNWQSQMRVEAIREAKKRKSKANFDRRFDKYREDPVAFGREVLKEQFTEDVVKVLESVRDNPVTIARSANGTGKTHGAARVAIWFHCVYQRSQVYTTAAPPLSNLKRLLWGEINGLVEKNPRLFMGHKVTSLRIQRKAKEFVVGVAIPMSGTDEEREAKFSGKHAPFILFIVDEGDAVPDEVYKGIESCMSGGMARLLIMFNPRAKAGPVYLKERDRQANVVHLSAFNHPNVKTGIDVIPGAVDRTTTIRRINEWTRPLQPDEKPDHECYQIPDFLVGVQTTALDGRLYDPLPEGWRKIRNPSFSYMVLGRYPAQSERQLISEAWINNARSRWDAYVAQYGERPPSGIEPVMGLDVAEQGGDSNAVCFRYGGFVSPLYTFKGMDTYRVAARALAFYHERKVETAIVDAQGIGSAVAPHMEDRGRAEKVRAVGLSVSEKPLGFISTEIGEFFSLREQLWWAVREWLRTDTGAMLPPDERLSEELRTPTYWVDDRGKIRIMKKDVIRDLLKRSPDRADALCLTFAPHRRAKVRRLQ